ncbi:O-antigen ligase family protein [Streptomyces sp. NPDC020681]|uniref:O-antigen ligase family protein n=1 Tax=Streptomyces sp. NPDC020681 TaxID=3365083 RepID=UPI00378A1A8B
MASDRTTSASPGLPYAIAQVTPLAATAVVLLDTATDFFPDDPLFAVVTPLRLALFAGVAALLIPVRGLSRPRLGDFRTRLDLPIALLLFASVATTYVGGHPTSPLRGLLTAVACYYLIVGLRRSRPESWRSIGLLVLVAVTAASTSAFSQVTNQTPTGFCRTGFLTDVSCDAGAPGTLIRAIGTFSNPNLLAVFLVLLIPFTLLAAVSVDERSARITVACAAVIAYGAVLTTFSRAVYVAAAAGLLVLGTAYWLAPRIVDRAQRRLVGTLGLVCLTAGAAVIWAVSRAGNSLGVRGQAWEAALGLAADHPLGVGLSRAGAAVSAAAPGDRVFAHSHNLWLNWLVETGPLGLLALVLVTVIAWTSAARAAREKSVIGTAGLAALTGFFLMGMMDHPANLDRIEILFWLVLGLVMAEAPASWRSSEPAPPRTVRPRHGPHHRKPVPVPVPAPGPAPSPAPSPAVSSSWPDSRAARRRLRRGAVAHMTTPTTDSTTAPPTTATPPPVTRKITMSSHQDGSSAMPLPVCDYLPRRTA